MLLFRLVVSTRVVPFCSPRVSTMFPYLRHSLHKLVEITNLLKDLSKLISISFEWSLYPLYTYPLMLVLCRHEVYSAISSSTHSAPWSTEFLVPLLSLFMTIWSLMLNVPLSFCLIFLFYSLFLFASVLNLFFIMFSVLPFSTEAISDHLFPLSFWSWRSLRSSSTVHGSRLISGHKWLCHLSLHCLPVL